jgi:cell division protein ZipA
MPELRWILIVAGVVILLSVYLWGRRMGPREEERETILRSRAEPLISSPAEESLAPDSYANEPYSYDPELRPEVLAAQPNVAPPRSEPRFDDDAPFIPTERREPVFDNEPLVIDADDEPTISCVPEPMTDEAPEVPATDPVRAPPTLGSATTAAAPKRPRAPTPRKILVLRLAAGPTRIPGDKLRAAFDAQGLTYGKYQIFHYVHTDGQALFSVASMVEPGSFDLEHMDSTPFPGVTMFAQLPSSISGLEVLEELLRNAKLLQSAVGGTLQDERGALLNSPRIQRLRQEVIDFEHLSHAQQDEVADSRSNA